ncbi:flagellar protein export ATPase FliI [Endozoicomonas ascidiicola]|uniref:flagellar protein export ATPase FliI n=1 Tax=Endozoicomonas ascidiicola TaxID=1698521 RepID=UPI000833C6FB|nr:flagellar protein export ATPase FliI [Endozoicomonas ascidiicola]
MTSLIQRCELAKQAVTGLNTMATYGRLQRVAGLKLEASGCDLRTGQRCQIETTGNRRIEAEVVGFDRDRIYLMAVGKASGLRPGDRIIPLNDDNGIPVGPSLLGRVIDAVCTPLDNKGPLLTNEYIPFDGETINPLQRHPVTEPLDVGVRAINSMLSVGKGQRLGLFAGSGVGKSVLLGMMTKFTKADIIVVGLVGERGREVREFIEHILGEEGLRRAVVVVSPADDPPLMRLKASNLCHRIAEYFRDQGQDVLLLMDSLTRYAQAQREVALAIGEPPATRGYPPSVFGMIPRLVERAGNGRTGGGSVTAFYTVLSEGDDQQDPIADAARAILDGHIVLSRELAEFGHYPAIDIEASASRVMPQIASVEHIREAQRFRRGWSLYRHNRDLLTLGAYKAGSDPQLDEAIRLLPVMTGLLQQEISESADFESSLASLSSVWKSKT